MRPGDVPGARMKTVNQLRSEVEAAVKLRDAAIVERSLAGPTLVIYGVPVRSWLKTSWNEKADEIAASINAAAPDHVTLLVEQQAEIDRLTAALHTARRDALEEAAEVCDTKADEVFNMSLDGGPHWFVEDAADRIRALITKGAA